ncbi:Glyoxalase/bleomycin resistance protein/dioxygenase [Natrialba chahannaoensis JCM 10990]|uniref:Glyoxalase/bleomycin resistance protein/dioxygenase n=1 Tax=Natrialba chahannaoensis JCM 10990 TaxID=1227492 RepID=M0AN26_9EURY|nr:ring-cleaving dioxygenase [Natrialba chahannaoensis]ELY99741.1 Glyoxalase/bleomycin resistance protein/dioxygenase [Natrialba chahannaoensis JCM 10990]
MLTDTAGIHHITGIVRNAQQNVEFYRDVLGLRLVKQTVNFNEKFTRHLFYGDETGSPGTALTFFPYPAANDGRPGTPQISTASLVIPPDSVTYWQDRLAEHGVTVEAPVERFDETVLRVADPDGTQLELVTGVSAVKPWEDSTVPEQHAIRGIHGVTLLSVNRYVTASVLETLGFDLTAQEDDRVRYEAPGEHATVIDLLDRDAEFGREGAGSIHHVAVSVPDVDQLYEWHDLFRERDYDVSRVKDRHFFHSLYVREPGGILFELATEQPGLTADSDLDTLGQTLYLPPWLETDREMIENQLQPLDLSAGQEST